jgi:ankyrin repeat protein
MEFLTNKYAEATRHTNIDHQTPLHLLLQSPCCTLESVEYMLDRYPTAALLADGRGWTPMHLACHYGASLDILKALARTSRQTVQQSTQRLEKPLHLACQRGGGVGGSDSHLPTIRWLLSQFPAAACLTTESFDTPLHLAVQGRVGIDVMKFLLQSYPGARISTNQDDETPFDMAIRLRASVSVLELLHFGS